MRLILSSKLHGVSVTQAELEYEGSFGIDKSWMDEVGIAPFESIDVYNITTGSRLRTYAIPMKKGSNQFTSNGAAAHLISKGDRVIIAAYQWKTEDELQHFEGPRIAIFNPGNELKRLYQPSWQKVDGSRPLTDFDQLNQN